MEFTTHGFSFSGGHPVYDDGFFNEVNVTAAPYNAAGNAVKLASSESSLSFTFDTGGEKTGLTLMFGIYKPEGAAAAPSIELEITVNCEERALNLSIPIESIGEGGCRSVDIADYLLNYYTNEVILALGENSGAVLVDQVVVYPNVFIQSRGNNEWMSGIDNNKKIADINIPGTHDSAAINKEHRTLYATQTTTLTEQMNGGVRLFDIRIKTNKNSGGGFSFVTCHGSIGFAMDMNEYQSFTSAFDEFEEFLSKNKTEGLIVSLKMDDWNSCGRTDADKEEVYGKLYEVISKYPIIKAQDGKYNMCTMSQLRGKIFLLNRMNNDPRFGSPIKWEDNTPGELTSGEGRGKRDFDVYVQDKFKGLPLINPAAGKNELVMKALDEKKDGMVIFNFASATYFFIIGVSIQKLFLGELGKNNGESRQKNLGWLLFDRVVADVCKTDLYQYINIVDFIIDSNFCYKKYSASFRVLEMTKDL
ncbi:MAG: hypothetical protein LBQ88_19305 [Treponema sp.]|nr:hypothetical protein [Treponema sp.]